MKEIMSFDNLKHLDVYTIQYDVADIWLCVRIEDRQYEVKLDKKSICHDLTGNTHDIVKLFNLGDTGEKIISEKDKV